MPVTTTSVDESAVRAVNQKLLTGLIERDMDLLDTLLAPDFVAVHITGQEQTRADWLEQISSGAMDYHHVDQESVRFTLRDPDTAVLVTRNRVLATIWGSRSRWPLESTTTYARRNGEWVITRSAASTY